MSRFEELGLKPELLAALSALGYEEPTPVQNAALPALLEGRDVLGQAATGTGKTAAFALPLLQRLTPRARSEFETSALVIVPTRELAMQVADAMQTYGRALGISVLAVYGGEDIGSQRRRLKKGIDVVVATPGRALDHIRRGSLRLGKVETVVLDEADEMLDLGFADDLEALLAAVPEERQTALFSATLPPRIASIAEKYLNDPVRVRIEPEKAKAGSLPKIRQTAYLVPKNLKEAALVRVLEFEAPQSALIFCRTRIEVDRLTEVLGSLGYDVSALHGGMTQEQRDRVLKRFKAHELEVLIATDVAARGIHVENLSHVINYDLPTSPDAYVHRIGRTGRAGREGVAISLLETREQRLLRNIERVSGRSVAIAQLPSVDALRGRRKELTRGTIEEALQGDGVGEVADIIDELEKKAELRDIAAAAIAMLHAKLHPGQRSDEVEFPQAKPSEKAVGPRPGVGGARVRTGVGARETTPGSREASLPGARRTMTSRDYEEAPARRGRGGPPGARIFIGLGTSAGVRPGDLVGAITNEAGLAGREIGAIEMAEHHAFVEVAHDRVEDVMNALRGSTIRGRKVKVDYDRRVTRQPGRSKR